MNCWVLELAGDSSRVSSLQPQLGELQGQTEIPMAQMPAEGMESHFWGGLCLQKSQQTGK